MRSRTEDGEPSGIESMIDDEIGEWFVVRPVSRVPVYFMYLILKIITVAESFQYVKFNCHEP